MKQICFILESLMNYNARQQFKPTTLFVDLSRREKEDG